MSLLLGKSKRDKFRTFVSFSQILEHGSLVEKREMNDALLKALHYLLLISEVEEVEIFKICLSPLSWNVSRRFLAPGVNVQDSKP